MADTWANSRCANLAGDAREPALAKRLEEDYAYKSATASSFQGFQKQMSEIGTSAEGNTPLAKLCENTLATIS